ncbi:MAG: outer membrane beta-barrel protein [Ignavibacteriaceae bacterium]
MKLWILLFLVLTLVSSNLFSQSKSGTILIGGKVNYHTSTTENKIPGLSFNTSDKYTEYSISPRLGYFVSDNAQLGIGLKYEKSKRENKPTIYGTSYDEKTSMFTITPSLRFYSGLIEKFGFYGEFEAAIGIGTMQKKDWDERSSYYGSMVEYDYDISENTISFNPGIYYKVTDKFSMELSIGGIYYSTLTTEVTKPAHYSGKKNTTTDFGFGFTFESLTLGMVYEF